MRYFFRSRVGVLVAVVLLAAVTAANSANAQNVVWNNGTPNGVNNGFNMNATAFQASDFTFAAPTTIDGIRFWDIQLPSSYATAGFGWTLYSDALGVPGNEINSFFNAAVQTPQANPAGGFGRMQNDMAITPLTLGAGTYWLVIRDLSNTTGSTFMFWEETNGSGSSVYRDQGTFSPGPGNWNPHGEMAYQLTGTSTPVTSTPEPASIALLATGLVGLLGATRRKRQVE